MNDIHLQHHLMDKAVNNVQLQIVCNLVYDAQKQISAIIHQIHEKL